MRAITLLAITAFYEGRNFKLESTEVIVDADRTRLFLRHELIAKLDGVNLFITNNGWFNATTKERLNGLRGVNITQKNRSYKNRSWWLNGKEWDGSWIQIL